MYNKTGGDGMKQIYKAEWTGRRFIAFLFPSIFTMLVLALYTMVDQLFVARFVGGDALAAVNIVFPFISFMFGVIIMLAVGGGTMVSILLGEGKKMRRIKNSPSSSW